MNVYEMFWMVCLGIEVH